MELENDRKAAINFFNEAISKWERLISIWNLVSKELATDGDVLEANQILAWFQENYPRYKDFSKFEMQVTPLGGKAHKIDPTFDVVFRGCTFENLYRHSSEFLPVMHQVLPQLRAHLASVRSRSTTTGTEKPQPSLSRVLRIVNRFHLAALQLRSRRKGKCGFQICDEYDVQDLLCAFLKLEFDDVRKEESTPSYAGASSKIDIVLKKEKIGVEAKKASINLTGKQIGDQLIDDIARYGKYPELETLICFVYDPDFSIENPDGLKSDLERLPTEKLKVMVVICPKSTG